MAEAGWVTVENVKAEGRFSNIQLTQLGKVEQTRLLDVLKILYPAYFQVGIPSNVQNKAFAKKSYQIAEVTIDYILKKLQPQPLPENEAHAVIKFLMESQE